MGIIHGRNFETATAALVHAYREVENITDNQVNEINFHIIFMYMYTIIKRSWKMYYCPLIIYGHFLYLILTQIILNNIKGAFSKPFSARSQ